MCLVAAPKKCSKQGKCSIYIYIFNMLNVFWGNRTKRKTFNIFSISPVLSYFWDKGLYFQCSVRLGSRKRQNDWKHYKTRFFREVRGFFSREKRAIRDTPAKKMQWIHCTFFRRFYYQTEENEIFGIFGGCRCIGGHMYVCIYICAGKLAHYPPLPPKQS